MDRKGWIILAICGILIALNVYFRPEPPKDTATQAPAESPASETTGTPAADGVATADSPPTDTSGRGSLVDEPPVEPVGENLESLTSTQKGKDAVEFTFTSRGGGIKTATMLNQFAVGSETEKVIGAL